MRQILFHIILLCGDEIDFSAPGSGVYVPSTAGTTSYKTGSGTSYSTPLITAAFALLKSENTNSSSDDLIELLKTYCTDLGDEGWDKYFGYGAPDFGSLMFGSPVIVMKEFEVLTSSVTVQMEAICSNNIIAYSCTTDPTNDLTWVELSDESNICTLEVTFSENGNYYVYFKDENGNSSYILIEITTIADATAPTAEVSYSTTEITNESVTVTITASEEIQSVSGWTLSSDSLTLTKTYTENTTEIVTIYDLAGNSTEVTVTITNISTDNTDDDDEEEDTKETYTLYLYNGDTLYSSQEITEGETITVDSLPTLTQSGYTFNGWADSDGDIIESDIEVTGDITLYASWTANNTNDDDDDEDDTKETYTLYLYNGDTLYSSQEITEGEIITVDSLPTLTQSGYTFNGWADSDGNIIESDIEVTGDITLYASWTENSSDDTDNSDDDDNSANTGTTNSNSSTNSSTSSTSTTTTNTSTTNSDSTTSTSSLPYTGTKALLIGIIVIFGAIAIVVRRKWNDLKGI